MIARITGTLIELDPEANSVMLEVGDIAYELMVPGYAVSNLSQKTNQTITLYCLEYYEGSATGGNLIPRMVGFPQSGDKVFFQRFISVKGIGIRKALRCLARPLADIAHSIEAADTKMLITLPEIGKRTAELIIAELKGKMADFAMAATGTAAAARTPLTPIETEALEILLQLGERATDAEEFIARALNTFADPPTPAALVQAVYRLKTGTTT
jgi:Holliday junction DNA helicase RuvA